MSKKNEMEVNETGRKKSVEEWYMEMNRQFEEDSKTEDYSISKEWDEDFQRAMFGEPKAEKRKKSRKLAYVAAGVAAVAIAGVGISQKEVIGDSLEKIFNNQSSVADSELNHFGTKEEMSAGKNEYDAMLSYKDKTLTEVYKQIRDSLKRPIFQVPDNLGEYEIEDAVYVDDFSIISLHLNTENGRIFISQKEVLDNSSTGTKIEDSSIVVWNENLQKDIVINQSIQDDSYMFSVQSEYIVFTFHGAVSEKICCEVAKELVFE